MIPVYFLYGYSKTAKIDTCGNCFFFPSDYVGQHHIAEIRTISSSFFRLLISVILVRVEKDSFPGAAFQPKQLKLKSLVSMGEFSCLSPKSTPNE